MTTVGVTLKALKQAAKDRNGGFSEPSKMPWLAWSTPARYCQTGSKLRKTPGSVCAKCYAFEGNYRYDNVQAALERRHETWIDAKERGESGIVEWAEDFAALLIARAKRDAIGNPTFRPDFRWFDSGDVESLDQLRAINQVAWLTQDVSMRHWLPTKERGILMAWLRMVADGEVEQAPNLVIRLSAPMVGQVVTGPIASLVPTSSVGTGSGFRCGAYTRGGVCGSCRACWRADVERVDYPLH